MPAERKKNTSWISVVQLYIATQPNFESMHCCAIWPTTEQQHGRILVTVTHSYRNQIFNSFVSHIAHMFFKYTYSSNMGALI